jgi:hypothetical protein
MVASHQINKVVSLTVPTVKNLNRVDDGGLYLSHTSRNYDEHITFCPKLREVYGLRDKTCFNTRIGDSTLHFIVNASLCVVFGQAVSAACMAASTS